MLLADVLRVLANEIEVLGFRRIDLYELLFNNILNEQSFGVEDTVKQLFSGARSLNGVLMRQLCVPEGFDKLCGNVLTNYLSVAGNYCGIFDKLAMLLSECPYMKVEDVKKITAACNYAQTAELARFVAACIVCGSYNTTLKNKKQSIEENDYALNLDYMRLETRIDEIELKYELWKAAQLRYISSHSEGGRFFKLDIIEHLLPQGHFSKTHFLTRGQTEDGTEAPLTELCAQSRCDIAIVGDGGIGKTTFLQHLMEKEFLFPDGEMRPYVGKRPVPFFIELNRCPDHIGDWYDEALHKTNFITRYIGQIKENHSTLDSVSTETIILIEKALQKIPADGQPQYLLLLDGFNEVRSKHSIRNYLSNEISVLHEYPNVRIITTSRETQAAYYASEFENIRLVGLKDDDIISHLRRRGISEPIIGEAKNCDTLMKCLRIPLYLCMFSAERGTQEEYLPETAGEILYSFFYRNSAFYNARRRMSEIRTSVLTERQVAFVLDFIIPYIGWTFEDNDVFSVNEQELLDTISDAMKNIYSIFTHGASNPFADFEYSNTILKETILSFYDRDDNLNTETIVSCIYDYFGIVYRDQVDEGAFADRIRYSFCHHHFRDYFSAMWNVQLLSMLQCVPTSMFSGNEYGSQKQNLLRRFLDERYWQTQKVCFISEVLMEHRNRPQLDTKTQNWLLPKPEYDEQRVLSNALDYCRELYKTHIDTKHILQNILAAILNGRKEYSGLDLSSLDLRKCNFFNVTCSRKGKTRCLAAIFNDSTLSNACFLPEDHQNSVMEYIYFGGSCFTIDDAGRIKCWDILSGRLEYELQSGNPLGATGFSSKGFIKVSPNGRWLAAKVQETYANGTHVYVLVFDLTYPDAKPKRIKPTDEHNLLTYFTFTEDSQSILILCDRKVVYCLDVQTEKTHYRHIFPLYKQSELHADSAEADIFAYTAEYNTYETDEVLMSTWISGGDETDDWCNDNDEEDVNAFPIGIPCELRVMKPSTGEDRTLYYFVGEPGVAPTISFFSHIKCFLLYNYDGNRIERFNCLSEECDVVLEELTQWNDTPPAEFHPHPTHKYECYIMYPNVCFVADIGSEGSVNLMMRFSISGAEKLLSDFDKGGELEFKTATCPQMNRFIVGNDSNTYEWDTANDVLIRKYNSVYYECASLIPNAAKDTGILIHRHNGVSLFKGIPVRLQGQYCFQEPGYLVDIACYDEIHHVLALVFARPDHEKVILLNLETSEEHIIYSTLHSGETIVNMCFSEDGCFLLITSQYQCLEFDLRSGKLAEVATAGDNERLAAGNYRNNEIEIAVVEHSELGEPRIKPYCVFYDCSIENGKRAYYRSWCYLMAELNKEEFSFFIYQNGDLGISGSNNSDGFQTYWVTRGFFLETLPELDKFFKPKCYTWKGKRRYIIEREFQPLDEIFVWHKTEITNRYSVGNSGFSYMYLADDISEAVITDNKKCLLYQNDLKNLTYCRMKEEFQNRLKDVHQDTYWDLAIPWYDGNLIGCFEGYNLTGIAASDNKLLESIEYYPGISIFGCLFKNVHADKYTLDIIVANGGIL